MKKIILLLLVVFVLVFVVNIVITMTIPPAALPSPAVTSVVKDATVAKKFLPTREMKVQPQIPGKKPDRVAPVQEEPLKSDILPM